MLRQIVGIAAATWMVGMPRPLAAQTALTFETAVTFNMALNLTQLSPDLERVRLLCFIMPSEVYVLPTIFMQQAQNPSTWPYKDELFVVGGKAVGTMSITYPLATEFFKDPIGKTAEYRCALMGFSRSLQRWDYFSETSTVPAYVLKPTPNMMGTFVW